MVGETFPWCEPGEGRGNWIRVWKGARGQADGTNLPRIQQIPNFMHFQPHLSLKIIRPNCLGQRLHKNQPRAQTSRCCHGTQPTLTSLLCFVLSWMCCWPGGTPFPPGLRFKPRLYFQSIPKKTEWPWCAVVTLHCWNLDLNLSCCASWGFPSWSQR